MSSLLLPLRDIWRTPKKFERDQQPDTQPFVLSRSYSCLQAYIRRDCGKIAIAYCEKEECEKREKKKREEKSRSTWPYCLNATQSFRFSGPDRRDPSAYVCQPGPESHTGSPYDFYSDCDPVDLAPKRGLQPSCPGPKQQILVRFQPIATTYSPGNRLKKANSSLPRP